MKESSTKADWWIFYFLRITWLYLPTGRKYWHEVAMITLRIILSIPAVIADFFIIFFMFVIIKSVVLISANLILLIKFLFETIIKQFFGKGLNLLITIAIIYSLFKLWRNGKLNEIFNLIVRYAENF